MIRTGEVLHNPVTGELVQFLKTSADTNGEYVYIECVVEPEGTVAAAHVHPYQTERFEIIAGEIGFRRGKDEFVATAGDEVVVEPGTPHKFWNAGPEEGRFRCEIRPALQFEQLLTTMYGLAADGKTNKKGMPSPLRLAVIANAHFADVRLPYVPAFAQKAALVTGSALGRLAGFTPTYEPCPNLEPAYVA
jgi:mannose-6-phosphate isomerase-like protein (cupin superfamily)